MAHDLRIVDGEASMVYTGNTPWHSLGQSVAEAMTAKEAITLAKLDYTVTKEKLFLADGREAPAFVTMASDTGAMLGVVGDRYKPLQNSEAFDFFDYLIADGTARFETAGALGNGERVWMLCRMPETLEIIKNDPINTYVLLSNSHDGSTSVEARYTSIRVVCANTLAMALNGGKAVVSLRHTESVQTRLKLAGSLLSSYQDHLGKFADAMKLLAKVRINDEMIAAFENQMFGDVDQTPEGRGRTILTNNLASFENLLVKGQGTEIPGVVGTAYGLVNAYTEWADFVSQVKGTQDRTNAIVFGNAAAKKTEALEFALVLAKAAK